MGSLTESFYDTMAQFMDAVPAGTTVVKATVIERTDEGKNEYSIKYLTNTLTAYASSETIYSEGAEVYVLVPDNNLKETLVILAGAEPEATATTAATTDYTYEVSNNYVLNTDWIKLSVSDNITEEQWPLGLATTSTNGTKKYTVSDNIISAYKTDFNTYRKLKLSCIIKTNIPEEKQLQGNYGLKLVIPVTNTKTNKEETLTYYFDTRNIKGNPYNLTEDIKQELIIEIADYYEAREYFGLYYFCNNFPSATEDTDGTITGFWGDPNNIDNDFKDPDYLDLSSISYLGLRATDSNNKETKNYIDIDTISSYYFWDGSNSDDIKDGCEYEMGDTVYREFDTDKEYNILIKDIGLYALDELSEIQKTGYYLRLSASQGNHFLNNTYSDTKTITPTFYVDGKETAISKSYQLYWFEEDLQIDTSSERYVSYAGPGWACLNTKKARVATEDKETSVTYITTPADLTVTRTDVLCKKTYKAILIYKDDIVSGTIDIQDDIDDAYTFEVTTDRIIYPNGLGKVNVTATFSSDDDITKTKTATDTAIIDTESITFDWAIYNEEGDLWDSDTYTLELTDISDDVKTYFETITFPAQNITDSCYVQCAVYATLKETTIDENDNKEEKVTRTFMTSKKIKVSTTEDTEFTINILNDNVLYKYDADGDSPALDCYDGPITSKATDILGINYTLYDKYGIEFSAEHYKACTTYWKIHQNSLLEPTIGNLEDKGLHDDDDVYNYYKFTNRESIIPLTYNIADQYNKAYALNSNFYLIIEFDGNTVEKTINIEFLKDGESGTNGTKYSALLGWIPSKNYTGTNRFYPYGKIDETTGLERKLKLIVDESDTSKFYYCSPEHPTISNSENISSFSTKSNHYFSTQVYKDGQILDSSKYTVEYDLFDSDVTLNGGKQLFKVTTITLGENTKTYKGVLKIISDISASVDENKHIIPQCYIIQAKIQIDDDDSGSSTIYSGNDSTIYCYYPLDLIILSNSDEDDKESTFKNRWPVIPSIEGGFSTVVYDKTGENPEYSTNKFTYYIKNVLTQSFKDDNPFKTQYKIKWYVENSMSQPYSSTATTSINKNGEVEITDSVAYITPYQKYDSNNSLNYIQATLDTSQVTKLYDSYNTAITEKENLKAYLDDIMNYIAPEKGNSIFTKNLNDIITELQSAINTYKETNKWYWLNTEFIDKCNVWIEHFQKKLIKDKDKDKNTIYTYKDSDAFDTLEDFIKEIESYNYQDYEGKEDNKTTDIIKNIKKFIKYINKNINLLKNSIENLEDIIDEYHNSALTQTKENKNYLFVGNVSSDLNNDLKKSIDSIKSSLKSLLTFSGTTISLSSKYQTICDIAAQNYWQWSNDLNGVITTDKATLAKNYKTNYNVSYVKPVVFLLNRYELSLLNGWDGNKLEINSDKNYIATPLIAAGKKEDNAFTGMWMGIEKKSNEDGNRIGLFGYQKGIQSVFINAENGSATFGRPGKGGQIIIDPSHAHADLYSSTFFKGAAFNSTYGSTYGLLTDTAYEAIDNLVDTNSNSAVLKTPTSVNSSIFSGKGMLIDLTKPFITFGNGKFSVNPNGALKSTSGEIGGWIIDGTYLKSKSNALTLSSNEYTYEYTDENGETQTKTMNRGAIYSNNHGELKNTTTGFYLSDNGLSIGSRFKVSSTGVLSIGNGACDNSSVAHWTISGDPNSKTEYKDENGNTVTNTGVSFIRYGTTAKCFANAKNYGQIYIGTDGMKLGKVFSVDNNGYLTSTSGTIGGWNIGTDKLYSKNENMTLTSSGTIYGGDKGTITIDEKTGKTAKWRITSGGDATFDNIQANGGRIGDWHINDTYNAAGSSKLKTGASSSGMNNGTLYSSNSSIILNGTTGVITCKKDGSNSITISADGIKCSSPTYLICDGSSSKATYKIPYLSCEMLSATKEAHFDNCTEIKWPTTRGVVTIGGAHGKSGYLEFANGVKMYFLNGLLDSVTGGDGSMTYDFNDNN